MAAWAIAMFESSNLKYVFISIAVLGFFFFLFGGSDFGGSDLSSGCRIDIKRYKLLQGGMTYEQARSIMGCEPDSEFSNSSFGQTSNFYTWRGHVGLAHVSFQNGRLLSKTEDNVR